MRIYSKAKSGKMSILEEREFLLLNLHCPFALHKVISEMTSSIDKSWNVSNRTQKHQPPIRTSLSSRFCWLNLHTLWLLPKNLCHKVPIYKVEIFVFENVSEIKGLISNLYTCNLIFINLSRYPKLVIYFFLIIEYSLQLTLRVRTLLFCVLSRCCFTV